MKESRWHECLDDAQQDVRLLPQAKEAMRRTCREVLQVKRGVVQELEVDLPDTRKQASKHLEMWQADVKLLRTYVRTTATSAPMLPATWSSTTAIRRPPARAFGQAGTVCLHRNNTHTIVMSRGFPPSIHPTCRPGGYWFLVGIRKTQHLGNPLHNTHTNSEVVSSNPEGGENLNLTFANLWVEA